MRALSFSRALVLAIASGAALALARDAAEGNGAVSAGDVLRVSSLSVPSSISVSAFATTLAPAVATAPPASSTTDATTAPTTTTAPKTATPASTSGATTSPPSNGATTTPSGSGVTCQFRYSMPTSSNVADELASAAAAAKKTKKTDGSMGGSSDGSGDSGVSVGSKDNKDTTSKPTTGSSAGTPANAGDAGDATAKTPTPSTNTPAATTKAPAKTPTPTKTPKTSAGSSDGSLRRNLAGMETTTDDEPTTPTPTSSSSSKKTPVPSPTPTKKSSSSTTETAAPAATSAPGSASATSGSSGNATAAAATGLFSCDATFYGAWAKLGLKCGDADLDVEKAVAQTQCLIYSGLQSSGVVSNMKMCMSVCRFPKCTTDGAWDYAATDGFSSAIYQNLNFLQLMRYAGATSAIAGAADAPFANLTMASDKHCDYESEASFSSCKCYNLLGGKASASEDQSTATLPPTLTVPVNKGLADSDHWADGEVKNSLAKVSIGAAVIGSSAATVSVVAGGAMAVASGIMGTTSAGVATGVSAGASVGITLAAVDICQFSIMINQMNLDARPRFLEDMGRRMAPAGYGFLPFWKVDTNATNATATASRRLADVAPTTNQTQGMERYAQLIGVQVDKLFYLTAAGVGALIAALFLVYGLVMAICFPFVSDFSAFARKWLDKAIGVLMMILILSEYVIGVTATFQFCWCIDNNRIDASLFLSIFTLLVLAIGTILYGIVVVKNHEDELRDLGTKDHFDKRVHARYGPLYDEYNFEGRFFFAPKLLLALLCGMTTGMVWLQGLWQIVIMIALHIVFLFYLEVKQPYPTQFVQKTSSFVIIIKISALFLSFFLISSATSFNQDLPVDLREGVGFAIVGLQVLVLICLMIRQIYIFYRTWKLKKEGGDDKPPAAATVATTNNRDGTTENFFALGDNMHGHAATAVLGDDSHQSDAYKANQPAKLRNLQPSRRTHTVVVHDDARGYRNNEVAL